jgi:hypothetical protein
MSEYDPDPPHKWQRKKYDETPLRRLDYRKDEDRRRGAEMETDRDLAKPMEQLVCDVHEETHDPNRSELANLAGAQKRMVSMMARVAKSSDRASFWMIVLTFAIALMTAALLLFTYWLWQDAKVAAARAESVIGTVPDPTPMATAMPTVQSSPEPSTSP